MSEVLLYMGSESMLQTSLSFPEAGQSEFHVLC